MFGRAFLWTLLCVVLQTEISLACPTKICSCDKTNARGIIAECNNRDLRQIPSSSWTNVSVIDLMKNRLTSIPSKAFGVQRTLRRLKLSRNTITSLKNGAFTGLLRLVRLELNDNDLITLTGEPFKGLKKLKNLDLSHNELNYIEETVFKGLKELRKLNLSYNKFIIIPEATLKPLTELKNLYLKYNDLLCDCHIKWLLKIRKLRNGVEGTCQYPKSLKNTKLKEISAKDMICLKLELPYSEFKPNNDEVALKGDSFTLECGTTWIETVLKINWYKDNKLLIPHSTNQTRGVIDFKTDLQAAIIISTLKFKTLSMEDSGMYRCTVSSDKTLWSGESSLKVLPGGSQFCHSEVTKTPKGDYKWENTDLGAVARLSCTAGALRSFGREGYDNCGRDGSWKGDIKCPYAYRKCDRFGNWGEVEANECAYVDSVTQKLYNLKQYPANTTTVLAICNVLHTITKNSSAIKSDIDVSYVASILESLRPFIAAEKKVGMIVVRIISNMMDVDQQILADAQLRSKACSSFVTVLEVLANSNVVGTNFLSSNVAMVIVPVFQATFQGRTCLASRNKKGGLKSIECKPIWKNASLFSPATQLEASIHLPKSIFAGKRQLLKQLKLKFMVYRNSKLFPHIVNGTLVPNPRVYTSVVNFHLTELSLRNMTEPIAIKYYNHEHSDKYPPIAVYWDQTRKGGIGAWMENKNCKLIKNRNTSISYCTRLADKNYFALLMSIEKSAALTAKRDRALALEAIVYVGAALCVIPLLITFITYAVFRKLRYNRDDAAMLMNLCLALLVSVILFAVGIYHVNNTLMCRAVGVLLHYFVLCSLLWVGCGALCLCRMLRTAVTPEEFNPVLRYYMISWGIPLIICGITVAGNPDNYSVQNYCYLKENPFLGAFVGPACLVILIDIILYIRLNNLIYETYSIIEVDTCTSALEEENSTEEQLPENVASKSELLQHLNEVLPEKSDIFLYQKGSLLVLVLIIINFALALLLVKFNGAGSLYLVFSCAYAIANAVLGVVVFVFHCLKKTKAKKYWTDCLSSCILKKKNYLVDQEVVPNTDSTSDKPSTTLLNGETPREIPGNGAPGNSIPRIYGAPSEPVASDIQSNVSLPSSAALTINDLPMNNINNVHRSAEVHPRFSKLSSPAGSDKHSITTSMSDKQSCVSAPLPYSHVQPDISDQHPPRYSYCFADSAVKKKKKKTKPRVPLALPDKNGISSSRESNMKPQNEPQPMHRPSENHQTIHEREPLESAPSELSSIREPGSYLETPVPYSSCASSDVSVPVPVTMTSRPPIPGAPDMRNFGPGTGGHQVAGGHPGTGAYPPSSGGHPGTGVYPSMGGHPAYPMVPVGQPGTGDRPPSSGGHPGTGVYPNMGGHQAYPPGSVGQPGTGDPNIVGYPAITSAPPNHYPRPMYVPANFNYSYDPTMRHRNPDYSPYPKTIPEERYVSIPKRPNGFVGHRHSESDHVYESIDEPQQNGEECPPNGAEKQPTSQSEQNGPTKAENEVTDSENTSLLEPPQTTNGPNLPRRRPRQRSEKSRTRRYRDAAGRRRDPSSRNGATRSSATSLKSDRIKPEPKEWVPEPVPRMTYVPIPHILEKKENRNETSV